jgi:hypothetical protein
MITLTASVNSASDEVPAFRRLWQTNWPLVATALACGLLLAATLVLVVADPRVITGAPAWIKPMKFALSTAIYSLTLVWMLGYVKGRPRLVGAVGGVTALVFVVELSLIVTQVIRGVRSHFNVSTAFDAIAFSTMGMLIMVLWLMNLLAILLVMRQKFSDPAFAWSLRLGLLLSSVGMGVAFLMTSIPTPAQMQALQSGERPQYFGAHSVGVEDGGASLPFVGWSTEGGDLRIPHFVGLHGMQVLPIVGLAVNRLFAALSARRRTLLVWVAGLGYLGLTGLLTWQALRGQSIVAPDSLTLGAFAGLAAAVLLAGALVARARRS